MRDNILLIKLKDLLMEIGEEETKSLLSDFCFYRLLINHRL